MPSIAKLTMTAVGPRGPSDRAVRTHGEGRTCSAPSCDTTLSTYNTGGTCWIHTQPKIPPAPRGERRDRQADPPRLVLSGIQLRALVDGEP